MISHAIAAMTAIDVCDKKTSQNCALRACAAQLLRLALSEVRDELVSLAYSISDQTQDNRGLKCRCRF